jgi:hypothetical protein
MYHPHGKWPYQAIDPFANCALAVLKHGSRPHSRPQMDSLQKVQFELSISFPPFVLVEKHPRSQFTQHFQYLLVLHTQKKRVLFNK